MHRLVRETVFELLAFDGDRGEVGHQREDSLLLVVEPVVAVRLLAVPGDFAEHRAAIGREDRRRARRVHAPVDHGFAAGAGRCGQTQGHSVGLEQEDRARRLREVLLDAARDRVQRLAERHAPCDLLENVCLVRGEQPGAPLIRDVVTDGLHFEHRAGAVEEHAVDPPVAAAGALGAQLPFVVGLELIPGAERLQTPAHRVQGQRVDGGP